MLNLIRGYTFAALAAILLLAAPIADAAQVSTFTGPAGTNPAQNPTVLGDLNQLVANVNTALAPPTVGITPLANGHLVTTAVSPVVTACGTTPAIVGSDSVGLVTTGTGTPAACTVTFATPYTAAPICTLSWQTGPLVAMSWTVTNAVLTITQTATNSTKVNYLCVAQSGG